jgi:hypothetical protein
VAEGDENFVVAAPVKRQGDEKCVLIDLENELFVKFPPSRE